MRQPKESLTARFLYPIAQKRFSRITVSTTISQPMNSLTTVDRPNLILMPQITGGELLMMHRYR